MTKMYFYTALLLTIGKQTIIIYFLLRMQSKQL